MNEIPEDEENDYEKEHREIVNEVYVTMKKSIMGSYSYPFRQYEANEIDGILMTSSLMLAQWFYGSMSGEQQIGLKKFLTIILKDLPDDEEEPIS